MTREEQMWKAVEQEHGKLTQRESYVTLTAMEWADATMIQKVCNWIRNNIDKDLIIYNNKSWKKVEEFIKSLKEAMEE